MVKKVKLNNKRLESESEKIDAIVRLNIYSHLLLYGDNDFDDDFDNDCDDNDGDFVLLLLLLIMIDYNEDDDDDW